MLESIGVVDVGTYALGSLLIVLCPGPNSIFVLRRVLAWRSRARAVFFSATPC